MRIKKENIRNLLWMVIPLVWSTLLCAGLVLEAAWLTSCRRSAEVSGPVVLYTSVPTDVIADIETAFEERYPSVDLQVYRAGTGDVMERVEDELTTGEIGADLIWVADFTVGEDLKEQGVLLQYWPPEADALLATLQDEEGYYFAARLLNMVVAYNTQAVTTPPTGYQDLLDPQYRGRVGHATPETSGSLLYFMGALLQDPTYGEDFFRQLAANEPVIQTNTKTSARIAAGELDIGLTIDFTVRKLLRDDPGAPIHFIFPETGVVMVPSPIAIFKDAANVEGAKVFERYILSKEGQTMLRDIGGFVPVRLDVIPPERITSITQLIVIPADTDWIREHREDIVSKFIDIYGQQQE